MTCAAFMESLDAFVDGELTPEEMTEMRAHLAGCASCAEALKARAVLRKQLKELPSFRAPDVLRARIRAAGAANTPVLDAPRAATARWARIFIAASIVVVTAGTVALGLLGHRSSVADDILASHLRSLVPGHLIDVQSTDQHNVKPWFNGRVDLSPAVPNLDSAGFPLLGGRVDYVGGRSAAVVVYGRRKHVINVFSWPQTGDDLVASVETKNGFHLVHLRREGIDEWIVSDLNVQELRDFTRRYMK